MADFMPLRENEARLIHEFTDEKVRSHAQLQAALETQEAEFKTNGKDECTNGRKRTRNAISIPC